MIKFALVDPGTGEIKKTGCRATEDVVNNKYIDSGLVRITIPKDEYVSDILHKVDFSDPNNPTFVLKTDLEIGPENKELADRLRKKLS
jgi:hypothetical protein